MPIRFPCEHCNKILRVSSSKTGKRAKCPNCQGPLRVPTGDEAAKLLNQRAKAASTVPPNPAAETAPNEPPPVPPPVDDDYREEYEDEYEDENPFSQFVVYDDDEMEIVYEKEKPETKPKQADVDADLLAVPRYVLYVQGALIGIVAVVCFALGIVVGGMTGGSGEELIKGPFFVTGDVKFEAGASVDAGAVVIVLPKDAKPEEVVEIDGLKPEDPVADVENQLRPIYEIGGDYARADDAGNFQLSVPGPGRYFVLVVSKNARRDANEQLNPTDNARVGRFFKDGYKLIGDQKYQLSEQYIDADQALSVVF